MSLQLPADALYGFTSLVRQLRQLVETTRGEKPEAVENSAFDEARYRAMYERSAAARSVRVDGAEDPGAPAPSARTVHSQLTDAKSAGQETPSAPPERRERDRASEDTSQQEAREAEEPPAVRATPAAETEGDIPAVRAEAESPVEDALRAELEPESRIEEAEAVWAQVREERSETPAAPPTGTSASLEEPRTAGQPLSAGPEAARSRRSSAAEELASPGPAPLTAEAVSLAFRRDGRRYDNGFPLY